MKPVFLQACRQEDTNKMLNVYMCNCKPLKKNRHKFRIEYGRVRQWLDIFSSIHPQND